MNPINRKRLHNILNLQHNIISKHVAIKALNTQQTVCYCTVLLYLKLLYHIIYTESVHLCQPYPVRL